MATRWPGREVSPPQLTDSAEPDTHHLTHLVCTWGKPHAPMPAGVQVDRHEAHSVGGSHVRAVPIGGDGHLIREEVERDGHTAGVGGDVDRCQVASFGDHDPYRLPVRGERDAARAAAELRIASVYATYRSRASRPWRQGVRQAASRLSREHR